MSPSRALVLAALLGGPLCAAPARAVPLGAAAVYTPSVPVSGLAFPSHWFDVSRLHFSQSFSFGSGGIGNSALSVTSMSYQFSSPLSMSVSLGNAWGGNGPIGASNKMFLEGFNLAYRPNAAFQFQVQYRDVRSPLQWGYDAERLNRWGGLP
ncbi:MAG TPA: hypothetical protein VFK69_14150 [Candidatus Eisenbacteria bacterium]|nr:hypothetical protein [Candidatus Eisenbacteria bacterium]